MKRYLSKGLSTLALWTIGPFAQASEQGRLWLEVAFGGGEPALVSSIDVKFDQYDRLLSVNHTEQIDLCILCSNSNSERFDLSSLSVRHHVPLNDKQSTVFDYGIGVVNVHYLNGKAETGFALPIRLTQSFRLENIGGALWAQSIINPYEHNYAVGVSIMFGKLK